jgi:hypothetical protein
VREPFQYAVLRLVPALERGECVNAGVVLFARTLDYLGVRVRLDPVRLGALAPQADAGALAHRLEAIARVLRGEPGAGPIARLTPSERFGWITAPSSTAVQASPIHTGLCDDPEATLERLFTRLVL